MNHIFKDFLKLSVLFFLVSFFIVACQKDDEIKEMDERTNINQTEFKISKIGKSKLNKNAKLKSKITKLAKNLTKSKIGNSQNKTVVSSDYGFTINTDYVNYIENADGTYHSYTFYMKRDIETDTLENLLLSLKPDGSYATSIITYNTTAQEKEDIFNGLHVDLANKVSSTLITDQGLIVNIFSKAYDCEGYVVTEYCGCNVHDAESGYSDCSSGCYQYDREYFGCGSAGGSSSSSGTGNGPGSGTSSGGGPSSGAGNPPNDGDDVTSPAGPCVGHDCPEDVDDCLEELPDTVRAELESIFGIGNFEIDCSIDTSNIPDELVFETEEELELFKQELLSSRENGDFELIEDTSNNDMPTAHFKFNDLLLQFNIYVQQNLGVDYVYFSDYSVNSVNSDISGLTTFVSWSQTSYGNIMDGYNSITDVYGVTSIVFIYKELPIGITESQHFRVTTNATDGSKISQIWMD